MRLEASNLLDVPSYCQVVCDRRFALGPGYVKTCMSRECAELFSLFSSFDGDCQSGSFLIQPNRDKLSTRKFDVGVFTQPGSKPEKLNASTCFPGRLGIRFVGIARRYDDGLWRRIAPGFRMA